MSKRCKHGKVSRGTRKGACRVRALKRRVARRRAVPVPAHIGPWGPYYDPAELMAAKTEAEWGAAVRKPAKWQVDLAAQAQRPMTARERENMKLVCAEVRKGNLVGGFEDECRELGLA
jgi:hypothetical protein